MVMVDSSAVPISVFPYSLPFLNISILEIDPLLKTIISKKELNDFPATVSYPEPDHSTLLKTKVLRASDNYNHACVD